MKKFTPLSTTAIGSVPFLDVDRTLDLIARACPKLPHWPQLVRRHPREDMVLQVADGLPLLEVDEENRRVTVRETGREEALIEFYEHFMANDFEYFRVPEGSAVGLTAMLKRRTSRPQLPKPIPIAESGGSSILDHDSTQRQIVLPPVVRHQETTETKLRPPE